MFPNVISETEFESLPEKSMGEKISLKFDFENGDFVLTDGKIELCTGDEALKIWIEKIIRTEKERFKIYENTQYGIVLEDLLVGSIFPKSFIESEVKREIEEALRQHESILGISSFEVNHSGQKLTLSFNVETINNTVAQEVNFNV